MTHTYTPVLRSLAATAVRLPMKRPLGTSAKNIDEARSLLVDVSTEDGISRMRLRVLLPAPRSHVRWYPSWPN